MNLVKLRNKMKKKKPVFIKQMSRQRRGLAKKWRRPRGSDSKIKIGKKGYPKKIKIGYKSPKKVSGLSRGGFKIVLIKNIGDLKKINKEKDIICLSNFGRKKKAMILKECIKLNLKILNLKDPSQFLKNLDEDLRKNKEKKQKKIEEKKKKASKKDEKKKQGIEAKVDEKEDEQKKKEKDKLLTKREI